ncbi:MAG: ECF transporter S component [Gemmatimonadales bacterium]|nr:ECF transporter S component [Gemmatimonadales bacterium]
MKNSSAERSARGSVRHPVLLGLFTGTAVGAGYLLAGVPNVELMTLITVLSGAALGPASGLACGMIAASIFSLGSPYGVPAPPLLVAQAVGLGLVGAMGYGAAGMILRALGKGRRVMGVILAGGTGLIASFTYDVLTNLAIIAAFDLEPGVVFWGAVPFFLIHGSVNITVFAILLPLVLPRLLGLSRSPLLGRTVGPAAVVFIIFMLAAPVAPAASVVPAQENKAASADSLAGGSDPLSIGKPDDVSEQSPELSAEQPVEHPSGWQRPIWRPFLGTVIEEMNHRSPFIPVVDGGLGSPVIMLGGSPTSQGPLFVRDGIPLGTGHSLADDPWLIPLQGSKLRYSTRRDDTWGGTGGRVDLLVEDLDPEQAVSSYRGSKGPHETYLRGVSLLTPQAEWRLAFDFEESLDNEGYNYTEMLDVDFRNDVDLPGHAKIRTSHTSVTRNLDEDSRLTFHYFTGRKTRDSQPSWGFEHQEIWDVGAGVRAVGRSGAWTWGSTWFWNDRDVKWGDRVAFGGGVGELRVLETAREGSSFELNRPIGIAKVGLGANFQNWEVHDSGAYWYDVGAGNLDGDGQRSDFQGDFGLPVGPWWFESRLGSNWDSRCKWAPSWSVQMDSGGDEPGWTLSLARDGRTPRSDEWLTPVVRKIGSENLFLLPNPALERENSLRAGFCWQKRILGVELAMDGGWERLREGITWSSEFSDPQVGTWENELELDSRRVTASATRQGSLFGWVTARLEGTWQGFDEKAGKASLLPPEQFHRLHLMWENHYFNEDGVLQLALMSTRRGVMSNPWDVSRIAVLPEITLHDLIVSFRLVGVHLSLAYRNLTSNRVILTTGSLSPGMERDMRLYWVFHQ